MKHQSFEARSARAWPDLNLIGGAGRCGMKDPDLNLDLQSWRGLLDSDLNPDLQIQIGMIWARTVEVRAEIASKGSGFESRSAGRAVASTSSREDPNVNPDQWRLNWSELGEQGRGSRAEAALDSEWGGAEGAGAGGGGIGLGAGNGEQGVVAIKGSRGGGEQREQRCSRAREGVMRVAEARRCLSRRAGAGGGACSQWEGMTRENEAEDCRARRGRAGEACGA